MKHVRLLFLIPALAMALTAPSMAWATPPHYNPCDRTEYSYAGADKMFESSLTPGIPWPAYADFLGLHWTEDQIQKDTIFDPDLIMAAINEVAKGNPGAPSDQSEREEYENFRPAGANDAGQQAYEAAADLYRAGKWSESIPRFDAIAATAGSPYRAAAAYSAARATLNLGNYRNALARIDRLASDPGLREFQLPALHLIGTRAWQSNTKELIAAHYAEIEHLLLAPPSLICRDPIASAVFAGQQQGLESSFGWSGDLAWYLDTAFPGDYANVARRDVLDELARHDPFYDLVRALAASTPYDKSWGWLATAERRTDSHNNLAALALRDSDAITADARDQWLKTKNPLWGYALAQRTAELSDVALIQDMLTALAGAPHTPAIDYAQNALHRHFVQHIARILLLNGKPDDALLFLRKNLQDTDRQLDYATSSSPDSAILNGGIRLFLEKFDLPNARRWAAEAGALLPDTQIDQALRPLLAANYDELLDNHVPGDGRNKNYPETYRETTPRAIWDFLPAQKMLALSSHSGLTDGEKRALLSSAWLRTVLLEGKQRGLELLPRLRESFPELATDIDDIGGAWLHISKLHLLTRLILRVPGFSPRPSWARADLPGDRNYYAGLHSGAENIFVIDGGNPNDGNWWCPVDPDQVKIDMAEAFFVEPLEGNQRLSEIYEDPYLPKETGYYWVGSAQGAEQRKAMLALADKLIAWHPLLKDADLGELDRLSKVENGPRLLSEQALAWSRHGNRLTRFLGLDKYLPETLHLAVRSTRYGCRREGSTKDYSRAAWSALHRLYSHSEWTTRTLYWFDMKNASADAP